MDFFAELESGAAAQMKKFDELKSKISNFSLKPDHIGYRCSSAASYEEKKKFFSQAAEFGIEAVVNSRRISTFAFKSAICGFPKVEIAEPKEGQEIFDGVEHIAFVTENLDDAYKNISAVYKTKPVREVFGKRLFKVYGDEFEIEFRDKGI